MANPVTKKPCSYCGTNTVEDANGCKYCAEMDGDNSDSMNLSEDCKYCQNMNTETTEECPYCLAAEAKNAGVGCPYCAEMQNPEPECQYCAAIPTIQLPTTTDSQNFAGQGMDEPIISKPIMGEDGPVGITNPATHDGTTNNRLVDIGNMENQVGVIDNVIPETIHDHGEETLRDIAAQIQEDPSRSASSVDATELPIGENVEGNVSRPTTYDQNTDSDLGMPGSDNINAPDLTDVLHEGLDNYADNIQREKVVQMISEALAGFKAQKKILDKAQMEAPMFHASCVNMLKVMIEMAKMLGFGTDTSQAEGQVTGEQAQPMHTNVWTQPFPTHPENGSDGQESGSAASAGSLPTTTTQHVPHPVQPEGSVNEKGQKKITNLETGRVSFVDMKIPRTLNDKGVPVTGK